MYLPRHLCLLFSIFVLSCGNALSQQPGTAGPQKATPGGARTKVSPALIDRLEVKTDIVYATFDGDRELALDFYRPKSAAGQTIPAIVCIHGGGWWQGTRKSHAHVAQALADRGYATATISYRLSGEKAFPAAIEDCKAAVRFLRANATKLGIDPERIGATGLSAGGHLACLLATSGGVDELEGKGGNSDQSSAIQAAVPMGAQSDFNAAHIQAVKNTPPPAKGEKPNLWTQFMGGAPQEVPETYALASPLTHLDAKDPPIHFITGELDREATRAEGFRARMKELEIPEGLTVIADAPHGFLGRQEFFDEFVEVASAWFDAHLKP